MSTNGILHTQSIKYEEYQPSPNSAVQGTAADILLLLEELGQLCLLVSRRRFASLSVSREHPHLEKYHSWIIAHARNAVISLASKHTSLDNITISARIEAVVLQLAGSSAAPIANIIHQICSHMGELLSGRALDDIVSEMSIDGQQPSSIKLKWTTLNTDTDPDDRDIQYDLIVVSDRLRGSVDVQSLDKLGKLLSSDGRLIVQELGSLAEWITYVFGLQSEWWSEASRDVSGCDKQLAAVAIRNPGGVADGKMQNLFTLFTSGDESRPRGLPESAMCRKKNMPHCDTSASIIAERIVRQLTEDGYTVTRSTHALTGQDTISVESINGGCVTVSVVYKSQR